MVPFPPIALAAALFASAVTVQETPPASGGIPIYDITPPLVPTPVPTPTPAPTPTPRAVPTPRATATQPVQPTPRATPVARATPTAAPTPRATPVAAPPVASPTPEPVATAAPTVSATPDVAPSPVAQPVPVTPVADGATPWWVWFLAGIIVAALAALLLGRLRRERGAGVVKDIAPVAPLPAVPVPVAPVPVAPVPPEPVVPPVASLPPEPIVPPVAPPPPTRFLEFQLAPLRVGIEGQNALLDFDLTVGNPASVAVEEVRIATLLLTANAQQDEQLAAFFASAEPRGLDAFALPPGQRRQLEATMALPRDAVNVVTRDRPFFVPLMAIDARYRWADGRESRTTAAFVIGPTLPNGKLAPIFLDRGDRMIDRLEARLHGEVRRT